MYYCSHIDTYVWEELGAGLPSAVGSRERERPLQQAPWVPWATPSRRALCTTHPAASQIKLAKGWNAKSLWPNKRLIGWSLPRLRCSIVRQRLFGCSKSRHRHSVHPSCVLLFVWFTSRIPHTHVTSRACAVPRPPAACMLCSRIRLQNRFGMLSCCRIWLHCVPAAAVVWSEMLVVEMEGDVSPGGFVLGDGLCPPAPCSCS
jgi:hypothetical protein